MICDICRDEAFLARKAQCATGDDRDGIII